MARKGDLDKITLYMKKLVTIENTWFTAICSILATINYHQLLTANKHLLRVRKHRLSSTFLTRDGSTDAYSRVICTSF